MKRMQTKSQVAEQIAEQAQAAKMKEELIRDFEKAFMKYKGCPMSPITTNAIRIEIEKTINAFMERHEFPLMWGEDKPQFYVKQDPANPRSINWGPANASAERLFSKFKSMGEKSE